jgi:hypothetical protein
MRRKSASRRRSEFFSPLAGLQLWRFCGRSSCRRGRCCRGEPKRCLQGAIPALPAEMIERLLTTKTRRQRARNAARV